MSPLHAPRTILGEEVLGRPVLINPHDTGKRTFPQSVFAATRWVTWKGIVPMLPNQDRVPCVAGWIILMTCVHVQGHEFVLNVAFRDTLIESASIEPIYPNVWSVAFAFRVAIIVCPVADGRVMPPHKMQSALCVTRLDISCAPR